MASASIEDERVSRNATNFRTAMVRLAASAATIALVPPFAAKEGSPLNVVFQRMGQGGMEPPPSKYRTRPAADRHRRGALARHEKGKTKAADKETRPVLA